MIDCSVNVADEPFDQWPYVGKSERVAKFAGLPPDSMENFILALDANSQSSLMLAWNGSPGCIYGGWRLTPPRA